MADGDDDEVCKVYSSDDFFTILVQIMLAIVALFFLYVKRIYEVPRRKFRTWALDMSKQAVGACYAHVLNMVIAAIIVENLRGDNVLEDQCAWYGICYLVDTTLGLLLSIIFVKMLDYVAHQNDWLTLRHSGVYEGVDGYLHWFHQIIAWLFILSIVKVFVYLFMWLASDALAYVGGIIFAPIQFNIRFELVFVMILFPGILNVIYFWIADSHLQAKSHHASAHEPDESGLEDKKESLITDEDKEEEKAYAPKPWANVESSSAAKPEQTIV